MHRGWLIGLATMLLLGCVTKPPRPEQVRVPDPTRLIAYQSEQDGDATIIVTRDVGLSGGACFGAVFIDGKMAAKLGTGERAVFHVPSGDRILGSWNTGSGLCGYREGTDRKEVSVSLRPGDIRKYRITINPGSGVELNPTTL